MGIPTLKIRRSRDRLIFNMGVTIRERWHLYIEMTPGDNSANVRAVLTWTNLWFDCIIKIITEHWDFSQDPNYGSWNKTFVNWISVYFWLCGVYQCIEVLNVSDVSLYLVSYPSEFSWRCKWFTDAASFVTVLQYDLCQKLNDCSAWVMWSHHLISNTKSMGLVQERCKSSNSCTNVVAINENYISQKFI